MEEKCPCEIYVTSCCACVSMHCDECHGHSKFVQGRFCSNCGRPLKAELTRLYVPKSEVERLEHLRAELSKEIADLQDALECEKETNKHLSDEYISAQKEIARLEKASLPSYFQAVSEEEAIKIGKEYGKREVARGIFEEIEGSIAVHAFTSKSEDYADGMYDAIEWIDSKIAELKKKYMEE